MAGVCHVRRRALLGAVALVVLVGAFFAVVHLAPLLGRAAPGRAGAPVLDATAEAAHAMLHAAAVAAARPLRVRHTPYSPHKHTHVGYGGATAATLLAPFGFVETGDADDDWDLLWTMMPQQPYLQRPLRAHQVHNHCLVHGPNGAGIHGIKTEQWRCFRRMQEKHGAARFAYMPASFVLPECGGGGASGAGAAAPVR